MTARRRALEIDAETGGDVLAEGERIEAAPGEENDDRANDNEGSGDGDVFQAAVGDCSHQPEKDVVNRKRIGREIERQRGQRARHGVERDPGENKRRDRGCFAGKRVKNSSAISAPAMPPSGKMKNATLVSPK